MFYSQMERSVPIGIPTDASILMASINQKFRYVWQVELRGQMQRSITIVRVIGVLKIGGVVFDDTSDEVQVLKMYGAADARGGVNPEWGREISWSVG